MTTWFVTRHQGALIWAEQQGFRIDKPVLHLDLAWIQTGDKVLGTLPVHLAAQVCAKGADYYHLSLDVPAHLRGKELSLDDMTACDARLERYWVTKEK